MEININNLNAKINADWSTVLSNIKGTEATEATEATALNARGLTMSSVNGDGTVSTVATAQPQLDAPEAADEYAIATLCAKLGTGDVMNLSPTQVETLCKEVKAELNAYSEALSAGEAAGVDLGTSTQSVMFDIYALMALLVECGQKMRDAARDVRQAENEQVQTSILNQADAQRSAAITGLICSVAVCAIQVGMQAYNLSTQGKSFAKQMEAQKSSGVAEARAELKMAEMQTKPQDAIANYEKVRLSTSDTTQQKVEVSFNDSRLTKLAMTDNATQPQQVQQPQQQVQQAQPQQQAQQAQPQEQVQQAQPQEQVQQAQPQEQVQQAQPQEQVQQAQPQEQVQAQPQEQVQQAQPQEQVQQAQPQEQVQQAQPQQQAQQVQPQQVNNEQQAQPQEQVQQAQPQEQVQQAQPQEQVQQAQPQEQVQAQPQEQVQQAQPQEQVPQAQPQEQVQQPQQEGVVQENQVNNPPQEQVQVQPQEQVVNQDNVAQQPQQQVQQAQPQPQAQPQQEVAPKSELDQYIETRKAELTELKTGGTGREIPMTKSQQVRADVLSAEINNAEKLKAMTPEERQVLYREQLKSELNDIRNNPDSTPEQIAYAEAYVAKELAQVSTTQQIKADLNTAQANFNQATAIMQQDLNYLKGVHMDTRSRAFGDMISAIGNVGQSCVSSITEMLRAEATEMGAEQQESQEMLDQAKDLFNQCQSLIDSVLQLMDGVLQAEVQSMRDAIQA